MPRELQKKRKKDYPELIGFKRWTIYLETGDPSSALIMFYYISPIFISYIMSFAFGGWGTRADWKKFKIRQLIRRLVFLKINRVLPTVVYNISLKFEPNRQYLLGANVFFHIHTCIMITILSLYNVLCLKFSSNELLLKWIYYYYYYLIGKYIY